MLMSDARETFTALSMGFVETTRGGVSSTGPPDGVPTCAHDMHSAVHAKNTTAAYRCVPNRACLTDSFPTPFLVQEGIPTQLSGHGAGFRLRQTLDTADRP